MEEHTEEHVEDRAAARAGEAASGVVPARGHVVAHHLQHGQPALAAAGARALPARADDWDQGGQTSAHSPRARERAACHPSLQTEAVLLGPLAAQH